MAASAKDSKAQPKINVQNQLSENIIDGRIFETDREVTLTVGEKAEMDEFRKTVKKYNDISRRQLMDAIKTEKEDLLQKKIKEVASYFEGTVDDRIRKLDTEYKFMEQLEKVSKKKK